MDVAQSLLSSCRRCGARHCRSWRFCRVQSPQAWELELKIGKPNVVAPSAGVDPMHAPNSAKNRPQPELAILGGDPQWHRTRCVSSGNVLRRVALSSVVSSGKEFDADRVAHSPYHRAPAPQAISNDQKGKSCRDAQGADHLQRRPSVGLVTNATGDRAPVKLNIS